MKEKGRDMIAWGGQRWRRAGVLQHKALGRGVDPEAPSGQSRGKGALGTGHSRVKALSPGPAKGTGDWGCRAGLT